MAGAMRSFDDVLDRYVGAFGWGQLRVLILASLSHISMACILMLMVFTAQDPITAGQWECSIALDNSGDASATQLPSISTSNICAAVRSAIKHTNANSTNGAGPGEQLSLPPLTTPAEIHAAFCALPSGATQWTAPANSLLSYYNLTCGCEWLVNVLNSLYFVGLAVGGMAFGFLSDQRGRRVSMYTCTAAAVVATVSEALAPSFWLHALCRIVGASAIQGMALADVVMVTELVGPAYRGRAGILTQSFFIAGECLLALLAALFPDFRTLTLVCAALALAFLATAPFVPESPRWLAAAGQLKQAAAVLARIAAMNGRKGLSQQEIEAALALLAQVDGAEESGAGQKPPPKPGTVRAAGQAADMDVLVEDVEAAAERCKLLERPGSAVENEDATAGVVCGGFGGARQVEAEVQVQGGKGVRAASQDVVVTMFAVRRVTQTPTPPAADASEQDSSDCGVNTSGRRSDPAGGSWGKDVHVTTTATKALYDGGGHSAGAVGAKEVTFPEHDESDRERLIPVSVAPSSYSSYAYSPQRTAAYRLPLSSKSGVPSNSDGPTEDKGTKSAGALAATDEPARQQASASPTLRQAICHPLVIRYTAVLSLALCTLVLSYYGIGYALSYIPGSLYVSFLLISIAEAPSSLLAGSLIDRVGRCNLVLSCMVVSGLACIACGLAAGAPVVQVLLAMLGKFGCSGAWSVLVVYCAEVFPTSARSLLSGAIFQGARVGGVLAPFVFLLGRTTGTSTLPFWLMGVVTLAAAVLCVLLPETRGLQQPESLGDLEASARHTTLARLAAVWSNVASKPRRCVPAQMITAAEDC